MADVLDTEIARRRKLISELREKLRIEEIGLAALEETARLRVAGKEEKARPQTPPSVREPALYKHGMKKPSAKERVTEPVATTSMGVLVVKALMEYFPDGATSPQLRDLIETQWNRTTTPNAFGGVLNKLAARQEIVWRDRKWRLGE